MTAGAIWWGQIGNSLRLLSRITNTLQDGRSAVLQVPEEFPWRQDFYDAVDLRRAVFSGERRLVRLRWEERMDPGEFVLEELCPSRVQAEYWPGKTYAQYLASKEDLLLNDYYVWIRNIHDRKDLEAWTEFVSCYEKDAEKLDHCAVFILEYDGVKVDASPIESIDYTVEAYDCRVFCLETASAYCNAELPSYQAELALCIGGNNPELSSALLGCGDSLLLDPIKSTLEILSCSQTSEGHTYDAMSEQKISSAAWRAAITLLFPLLEQKRFDFIVNHYDALLCHLPISNSSGEHVTDPYDLEVGPLYYIVKNYSKEFSAEEVNALRLYRRIRNLLAHNNPVPYEEVKKVIQ